MTRDTQDVPFRAHTRSRWGHDDPVATHLHAVSERAAQYARAFGAAEDAAIAGLLHDLGKYGNLFQRRLDGLERGIDHWSPGAWACLLKYGLQGVGPALAIQGHHIGLQQLSDDAVQGLSPEKLAHSHPQSLRLSGQDTKLLVERLCADGIDLPPLTAGSVYREDLHSEPAALALDIRMLFSALVDADFIETEAHFNATGPDAPAYRAPGPALDPALAEMHLRVYIEQLRATSDAPEHVQQLRNDLLDACTTAGKEVPGLFTLTAPTGAGKTLSMLAFALRHARMHDLRRIVLVLPYLSIIDQTVQVCQKALGPILEGEPNSIIEDHSLARPPAEEADDLDRQGRLLAENWDAPIVVTTSVQMLESLMSNRPRACRKLHRLARSVILFDEVQTLPAELATLSRLSDRYDTTVVFSTATQPAFDHLHESVSRYCATGWRPREIVPDNLQLFDRARRTAVRWPENRMKRSWKELALELAERDQVLCITNLKRHALELYHELNAHRVDGLFHLSTSMCPAHRLAVLAHIRRRLKAEEPCRLVSTQCVEAGVDIDFPAVYRALAPLDSIAQAAGRCNREGRADSGDVHVFMPDDDRLYPGGGYQQAATVTEMMLRERGGDIDINDPEVFDRYYRALYDLKDLAGGDDEKKPLIKALKRFDFEQVARLYRIIDQSTINVLVPYEKDVFDELAAQVLEDGLSREWIARARPHSVGVYQPSRNNPIRDYIERVPVVPGREYADDWFILRGDHYCERRGFVSPDAGVIIA
ncbi:MAG: CRISPR-associated endonuclease Cas3'' [Armatimonadota bacterium]